MGYSLIELEKMIGKKKALLLFNDIQQNKGNKYGAIKTNGFDSKKEYNRNEELLLLEKSGQITDLKSQVSFILLDNFEVNGQKIRGIKYIADFVYIKNGKKIVEDVKGGEATKTNVYKIKKKLFLNKFGQEYDFIET